MPVNIPHPGGRTPDRQRPRVSTGTLRTLTGLLLAACALAARAAPEFPEAEDLRREASGGAVLVLFSLPGCRYCDEVRALHLGPLRDDPRLRKRIAVREIEISGDAPLVDFRGERTTHRAFAKRHGVTIAPTVIAWRPDGSRAGDAIVGAKIPEFYGHYLGALVASALDPQGRR